MAGGSAAALDDTFARLHWLLCQSPFAGPAASEVVQSVTTPATKTCGWDPASAREAAPCSGSGLLDGEGLRLAVFDGGDRARMRFRDRCVMESDVDRRLMSLRPTSKPCSVALWLS